LENIINQSESCIETIRVEDGTLHNLHYHQQRMNTTRAELWRCDKIISLKELITVPEVLQKGLLKCRITYNEGIENVEWEPYQLRSIKSLKVVSDDCISYSYKFKNRVLLQQLFNQRGLYDDVLIVKKGLLTDTSYCNIALFDGQKWYTPTSYLLPGTQRAHLLDVGVIEEKEIALRSLQQYSKIRLFNAMIPWETAVDIDCNKIY
jgi:4-amino-4-deoxychorismate lyase